MLIPFYEGERTKFYLVSLPIPEDEIQRVFGIDGEKILDYILIDDW